MSSDSTLGRPAVGPLIDALRDDSPATRLAVLDALTRLPLEPDCWFEVREYVMWALEDGSAPEHLDVIELATRVPIRSVRQRLVGIAENGEAKERQVAALALGRAEDDQAAAPLLTLLDDSASASEAAQALTLIDTSTVVDELERRWKGLGDPADGNRTGFWLAVALARNGRGEPLAAELERLAAVLVEEAGDSLGISPDDDAQIYEGLARIVPLPEEIRPALDREWQGYFVQGVVSDVLFSSPSTPEAAEHSTWTTSVADVSAAERELVQNALGSGFPEHDPYQAAPVAKLADDLYRALATEVDRSRFDSLLVSALLLVQAGRNERQSGDDAVLLASVLGAGYAPDVDGLLEAWRETKRNDDLTRNQIAWVTCRAPLSQVLERLAQEIASDPETLARFIGAAASWAKTAEPPLTPAGDEPKAPELAPPSDLINDMLMAAPPPEMAAPNGPPSAEANGGHAPGATRRRRRPSEVVEANGGAEAPSPTAPRWILVWVTDAAEPEQPMTIAFRAGAVHEIAVAIGPNQEGAIAAVGGRPFDEELGAVADMEELTVTFLAPSISMQQSGSIFLPRTGTSRRVTFAVKLPSDLERLDAEIRVHHKNRVVQMARLSGLVLADPAQAPPGSRIDLEVATIVPDGVDLSSRGGADAGIVSTSAGTTAIADKDLVGFDDDRLGRVVREGELLEVLTGLATGTSSRQRKLEDAVDDLRALVFQGCELYPVIGEPLVASLAGRPLDRLQVLVDERSDFFPLELVYDLPAPAKDATLCPGWKAALKTGTCSKRHEPGPVSFIRQRFARAGSGGCRR